MADFTDVKVGDVVTRMLGGEIPMKLNVTAVDDRLIHCGGWTFLRTTGGEVDEGLGWDGVRRTGSILVKDDKGETT